MTFETSTHIWPVCQVGGYDGQVLDPDVVLCPGDYQYNLDDEEPGMRIVSWEFRCDEWDKAVVEAAQKAFDKNKPLEKWGVKVKVTGYGHPKEYNFTTDWLDLTVDIGDEREFVKKAVEELKKDEHRRKIDEFIKENWHSRDGFNSWMSETYREFFDDAKSFLGDSSNEMNCWGGERFLGEVLTLLSLIEGDLDDNEENLYGYGDITEEIVEDLSENHSADEFYLVYDYRKLCERHGVKLIDFDPIRDEIDDVVQKYVDSFGDDAEQSKKAKKWQKDANKRLDELENEQFDVLDNAVSFPGSWNEDKADEEGIVFEKGRVTDWIEETRKELDSGIKTKPEEE